MAGHNVGTFLQRARSGRGYSLAPVRGIERSQLRADWHRYAVSKVAGGRYPPLVLTLADSSVFTFATSLEIVLCDIEPSRQVCLRRSAFGKGFDGLALLVAVSFGGRPMWTPRALARSRPSPVRARISSRSNSASPPSTVSINRPCGVVVSAHASPSERNPAPAFAIVSRMFKRSRVDRASRSSRVTSRVSPSRRARKARANSRRSVLAPLAVSGKIFSRLRRRATPHLSVNALTVRAHPRISENCHAES